MSASTQSGAQSGILNTTRGRWVLVDDESAKAELLRRARVSAKDEAFIIETVDRGRTVFTEARAELLPTLDAVLAAKDDAVLRRVRDQIEKLRPFVSEREITASTMPSQFMSRDSAAMSEGLKVPPHLQIEARIVSQTTHGVQLDELAKHARYLVTYLQKGLRNCVERALRRRTAKFS